MTGEMDGGGGGCSMSGGTVASGSGSVAVNGHGSRHPPATAATAAAAMSLANGDQQQQPHRQLQPTAPAAHQPKMPGCVWTNEAVTLLLTLYLHEQQLARQQKLKKKDVWRGICSELWRRGLVCSWQECDKKYRNLKQTFVRNLKQAGRKECRWMFFPLMLEINKHEPFVGDAMVGGGGEGSAFNGAGFAAPLPSLLPESHGSAEGEEEEEKPRLDDLLLADEEQLGDSPRVMNLSQRSQRTSPMANGDSEPLAKRRRLPENGYHSAAAGCTAIKLESPQPGVSGLYEFAGQSGFVTPNRQQQQQQQPQLLLGTAIKRSDSPPPQATPPFERPLVPLDIRLLQALPFVAQHHQPNQNHQHDHHSFLPAANNHLNSNNHIMHNSREQLPPPPIGRSSPANALAEDNQETCSLPGELDGFAAHNHRHQLADGSVEPVRTARTNAEAENDDDEEEEEEAEAETADYMQQPEAPRWFHAFMAEFRRHEQRKLREIRELCAQVRRSNEIEVQRNLILSEKNDLLRHLNPFMLHK